MPCNECKVLKQMLYLLNENCELKAFLTVFIKDYEEGITAYDTEWLYKKAKKLLEGEDIE